MLATTELLESILLFLVLLDRCLQIKFVNNLARSWKGPRIFVKHCFDPLWTPFEIEIERMDAFMARCRPVDGAIRRIPRCVTEVMV